MKVSRLTVALVLLVISAVILYITLTGLDRGSSIGIGVGDIAPNLEFTLSNGSVVYLSDFKGHYVLLYLVATWCPDCALGTAILARYVGLLESKSIYVIVLEQYDDLGYNGPSITSFVKYYAGNASTYFITGEASLEMTKVYNPSLQLEVYYLISPSGKILYSGTGLADTYPELIQLIEHINS
ncbi:MAG: redoxin family protein [Caldivirga sp.]|jgi:thiol-disulfide isomerase/thioredoxin